jgi:putative flippase GtrA
MSSAPRASIFLRRAGQICALSVSLMVNYDFGRRAVFLSRERHSRILPRYLALAAVSGLISYSLINLQVSRLHMPVIGAKLLAESLLFLGNFAIQRDFVFTKRNDASGVGSSHDPRP